MELTKEKIAVLNQYLTDFYSTMSSRSLSSLFFSDFFKSLLEWHFAIWEKQTTYLSLEDKDIAVWSDHYKALGTLDLILNTITERVLSESDMVTFYFFDQFPKHVEKYKEKKIMVKNQGRNVEHFYADQIMTHFFRTFFSKIASAPNSLNIWEMYFPKYWLIYSNPLANSKPQNIVPRIALGRFIEWAQSKISSASKKEWDKDLDDVSENLFPDTDPVRWSKILIFVLSPFDPKNRVGYVISIPWNFGFIGRAKSYSGYEENDQKFQEKYNEFLQSLNENEKYTTCKLALSLFSNVFTPENLKLFIEEAKSLSSKYLPDSEEEKKRKYLLQIFEELRDFKEETSKSGS